MTVVRLHRDEVNAAQHAFSMRATVPGTARFLAGAGAPGFPGADAVDILRERQAVVRVAHPEVHAMIRAAIAHADVPVLGDGGQVGLVRHHARGSSGVSDGRTTELLRARLTADLAPVKSSPAEPRQPARGDEPAAVTGSVVPGGAGASSASRSTGSASPPIDGCSANSSACRTRWTSRFRRSWPWTRPPGRPSWPTMTGDVRPCRSGAANCVPYSTRWSLTPL